MYDNTDVIIDLYDADGCGAGVSPAVWNRYLWNPQVEDQLLAQESLPGEGYDAELWWTLPDRLGSVCERERADNGVTLSYFYDALGKRNCNLTVHAGKTFHAGGFVGYQVTIESGATLYVKPLGAYYLENQGTLIIGGCTGLHRDLRYLYTCQEWDSIAALYYYDNRWYDSATGRFWSQDPISFAAGDENLYRYCGNDPVNATDPSGNRTCTLVTPPIIVYGPITYEAYAGGIGVGVSPNPGITGISIVRTLVCRRTRNVSVLYNCVERCGFLWLYTRRCFRMLDFPQWDLFEANVPYGNFIITTGIELPAPKIPGLIVTLYGIQPDDQQQADNICAGANQNPMEGFIPRKTI